jgi:peroxin-14
MIGNAVAFLTHPKVINSPEDRKRKFLKQKGLTDEEINEAILRSTGTNRSLTSFPVSTTSSSYPNSSSAQLPSNNNSLDYGRVPQNPTYTRTQLSSMSSFPPPLPISTVPHIYLLSDVTTSSLN